MLYISGWERLQGDIKKLYQDGRYCRGTCITCYCIKMGEIVGGCKMLHQDGRCLGGCIKCRIRMGKIAGR